MIKNAEKIQIGGIGGLKIYGLDFTAATFDSPAELTAILADKNNSVFQNGGPSLSYLSPVSISIGNLNFTMYAVSRGKVKSSSGESYTKMKYIDGSFLLDKYFVGLKTKHWDFYDPNNVQFLNSRGPLGEFKFNANPSVPTYPIPANFIMVGEFVDPCKNKNLEVSKDPCDPCPKSDYQDQEQAKMVDCIKARSLSPLDVEYGFQDLILAAKAKGFRFSINGSFNVNYKAKYTGSLRSVIQNWCSDFGLAFVFNAQNNTFVFFDPKAGINIPSISDCIITGESEEESIEHNFAKGIISRYARGGGEKDFKCEASYSQIISCRPLTLQDLIGKTEWTKGMPLYTREDTSFTTREFDMVEFLCMLSAYHPNLRESVSWYDLYGLRTAEFAKRLVTSSLVSSGIAGLQAKCGGYTKTNYGDDFDRARFTLPALAMTVKAVVGKNDVSYGKVLEQASKSENIKNYIETAKKKGWVNPYFVVAYQDESRYTNLTNWEANIGKNFLGKFFIRKFNSSMNSHPEFQPAPDAQAKYYKQRVDSVEFAQFLPYKGTYIDELSSSKSPTNPQKLAKESFILVNRTTVMSPPSQESAELSDLLRLAEEARPIKLGSVQSIMGANDTTILNQHPSMKGQIVQWDARDCLYLAFEGRGFNPSINTTAEKFPDLEYYYTTATEYAIPSKIGLQSNKSLSMTINGVKIYYPPSSTVRESNNGGRGYDVFYKAGAQSDYKLLIPKAEFVEGNIPNALSLNVPNFEIDSKEFTNSILPDLAYLEQTRSCKPNERAIRSAMNDFNSNMAIIQTNPFLKKNYELEGIPTFSPSAYVNLESFSVRISEKGIKTEISFSNLRNKKILKSDAIKEQEFKDNYKSIFLSHPQFIKGTNLLSSVNNNVIKPFTNSPPVNQPIY